MKVKIRSKIVLIIIGLIVLFKPIGYSIDFHISNYRIIDFHPHSIDENITTKHTYKCDQNNENESSNNQNTIHIHNNIDNFIKQSNTEFKLILLFTVFLFFSPIFIIRNNIQFFKQKFLSFKLKLLTIKISFSELILIHKQSLLI